MRDTMPEYIHKLDGSSPLDDVISMLDTVLGDLLFKEGPRRGFCVQKLRKSISILFRLRKMRMVKRTEVS